MKKVVLSLDDLKVDSLVTLVDEELKGVYGAITAGTCTDVPNCNSDIGTTNLNCCTTSRHYCCQTGETAISTGICCSV